MFLTKFSRGFSVCLVALIIAIIVIFIWSYSSSSTPESAIRKYVFNKGNPIDAMMLMATKETVQDSPDCVRYVVDGYYSEEAGGHNPIPIFCLNQTQEGWIVTGAGTGP